MIADIVHVEFDCILSLFMVTASNVDVEDHKIVELQPLNLVKYEYFY